MGTFLFQQFPCLAFTSQWPIQQQVMPWHIQLEPITEGCAGTSWIMKHSTETTHGRQDDLRGGTLPRDVEHALVHGSDPGGSSDPSYRGLQRLLLLMSCKN